MRREKQNVMNVPINGKEVINARSSISFKNATNKAGAYEKSDTKCCCAGAAFVTRDEADAFFWAVFKVSLHASFIIQ